MEFLFNYGLFLAKAVTLVVAIGLIIGLIASVGARNKRGQRGQIEITHLNELYKDMADALKSSILDPAEYKKQAKAEQKAQKKELKAKKNAEEGEAEARRTLFVVNFDGDIKASATDTLREEITAILSVAKPGDEVVVKLESPGGLVHSYGFAASQLARVKSKGITLTACVDKVAASGGYMMACVANRILAAPFAVIGSIGVVAQLPNFHKVLKKHDIDYDILTAGEYKRTLTVFGENTEKGRRKFIEDLEDTHSLFKTFVEENRQQVDVPTVATGEVWFGRQAIEHQLVDDLSTSDAYLTAQVEQADIFEVAYVTKKSLHEKLGMSVAAGFDKVLTSWAGRLFNTRPFQ